MVPAQALSTVSFLCEVELPPIFTTWGAYRPVNLFRMHIILLLTISAGTHFTYPQRDEGFSQPPARLSQEQLLNPGPHMGRSAADLFTTMFPYCKIAVKFNLSHTSHHI